jgi:hypothetical protein
VDVTCKTHHECVKLIKKTGDTLALKVYTSKSVQQNFSQNSANFASTCLNPSTLASTLSIYQSPSTLLSSGSSSSSPSASSHPNYIKSYSYYASSTITTPHEFANHHHHQNHNVTDHNHHHYMINSNSTAAALFLDGTKSLPNKKKRNYTPSLFFLLVSIILMFDVFVLK